MVLRTVSCLRLLDEVRGLSLCHARAPKHAVVVVCARCTAQSVAV